MEHHLKTNATSKVMRSLHLCVLLLAFLYFSLPGKFFSVLKLIIHHMLPFSSSSAFLCFIHIILHLITLTLRYTLCRYFHFPSCHFTQTLSIIIALAHEYDFYGLFDFIFSCPLLVIPKDCKLIRESGLNFS